MPDKWTGDLIGLMHNERITMQNLADELLVTKAYVSMVLNGARNPKGAKERFEEAVNKIFQRKKIATEVLPK